MEYRPKASPSSLSQLSISTLRSSSMQPILVSPQEIRGIVTMNEAVEAVRLGFREWGENPQLNAPRRRIHIPTGVRVSVHQGGVPAAKATGLMTHCEWVKPMANEQVYPRLNHPVIVLYDCCRGRARKASSSARSPARSCRITSPSPACAPPPPAPSAPTCWRARMRRVWASSAPPARRKIICSRSCRCAN